MHHMVKMLKSIRLDDEMYKRIICSIILLNKDSERPENIKALLSQDFLHAIYDDKVISEISIYVPLIINAEMPVGMLK